LKHDYEVTKFLLKAENPTKTGGMLNISEVLKVYGRSKGSAESLDFESGLHGF